MNEPCAEDQPDCVVLTLASDNTTQSLFFNENGDGVMGEQSDTDEYRRNLIWAYAEDGNSTSECMDDSSWVDNGGDDCSWYDDNDYACG